jgi:UDP-N-acetylmuramoyl-L-alanyl-D-glutamate--2,6-diaminopimelate ligase
MTELGALAGSVEGARLLGPGEFPIRGLSYDSRQAKPGDLFFCVPGAKADGRLYLPDAIARGAVAAVVESEDGGLPVPALLVPSVRAAMPAIAARFYDYPSRRLKLVGVTGTNGKTTTTYLIESLARAAGSATGVIGTIGTRINDEQLPAERTTPEAPDLQSLLARMAEAGGDVGTVVAMEVSSHALCQDRTLGCEYDVAVFTNLTQDHLDYHGDMESYFEAKATLFTRYPGLSRKPFTAVINVDDPYGRRLAERSAGRVLTYAVEREAALRAEAIEATPKGLSLRVRAPEGVFPLKLRLGGLFNVYNSLAAIGAARSLGIEWESIVTALERAQVVPGRFESVDAGQDFGVIVDYAHSPDGLKNVLRAARDLNPRRLLVVFGCGGDRDRTKRPIMGQIAAELADRVIVTSDNPRSEEPGGIVHEIVAGIPAGALQKVETEIDRRTAIRTAVGLCESGDLLVIAGKGHENYQIFAGETIHFDDREEAREALNDRLSA